MSEKTVLDRDDVRRTLVRIAHEIVETTGGEGVALVGIHRRGAVLGARLRALVAELVGEPVPLGDIDITFYRDDVARRASAAHAQPVVHATHLDFPLEGTTVVLVDDVLYTGRTIRAAIDALFDYGRPARVQLAVLVDRGHRELPIRPDYVGKNLPTARDERVNVRARGDRRASTRSRSTSAELDVQEAEPHDGTCSRSTTSTRDDVERILRPRRELRRGRRARDQEGARRCAAARRQPLLRVVDAHQLVSFELAAKRLSRRRRSSIKSAGSSVDKGESLKDTVADARRPTTRT